jgi:Uma2 family endonuclease
MPSAKLTEIITDISQLDLQGRYSYADYLSWQIDEYVELIKGKLFRMSPAPSMRHQRIAGNAFRQIGNLMEGPSCKVFFAPFDVRILDKKKSTPDREVYTVVQPDISVICDSSKLDARGCLGAPDLIVEIISPATRQKDLTTKFSLYEEAGVREYWIIHPTDETVTVFDLDQEGKYRFRHIYPAEQSVPIGIFGFREIELQGVFAE